MRNDRINERRHSVQDIGNASGRVSWCASLLGDHQATMTLDTYRHLFENRLDEVADAMDLARTNERAQLAVARVACGPG